MRLDSEWSRPRNDFRGAVMLAETSKDAGKLLSAFVTSLGGTTPRWMSMMINPPAKES